MVRGETQYNKMSRFLKEVPVHLFASKGNVDREEVEMPKQNAYFQAKQTFKTKAFATPKPVQNFGSKQGDGPGYDVGDRVRHMKFGEGLVLSIVAGGRDFEVTVDFDNVGVKKMFAGFAKLQKI